MTHDCVLDLWQHAAMSSDFVTSWHCSVVHAAVLNDRLVNNTRWRLAILRTLDVTTWFGCQWLCILKLTAAIIPKLACAGLCEVRINSELPQRHPD